MLNDQGNCGHIRVACENYLNHLNQPKSDADQQLTTDKQTIVKQLLEFAKSSIPDSLQRFEDLFKKYRYKLEERRDSATRIFLKVLLSIFTVGIACACGLWKIEGEKVAQEFNHIINSASPSL